MWFLLLACAGAPADTDLPDTDPDDTSTDTAEDTRPAAPFTVDVTVTLDGAPAPDTLVMQGGASTRVTTDADGHAAVVVDPAIVGDLVVLAAHLEARVDGEEVEGPSALTIALVRYDTSDNLEFSFADPGPEDLTDTNTSQCGHCHVTIHDAWYDSPHRGAASNPVVHDLYAGTASFDEAGLCAAAGGAWGPGTEPGTGAAVDRCFLGAGVLTDTEGTGACADCHAPGIDGELGGRDLLEATGIAYDAGVHCDVCHHVDAVDLDAAPGVAGRLHIVRPSEPSPSPALGVYAPLAFGPLPDVISPRMGAVYAPVFHTAELCAGCHEQEQEGLAGVVDTTRWPTGKIPVHSTYTEWAAGPMNPSAPCQSCHMPPMPEVGNSSDLHNEFEDIMIGIVGGWERPPGAVRAHSWYGPRQPDSHMLESAASVGVVTTTSGGTTTATVTVTNVGPGHALPTGEPLRSVILLVDAACDGAALVPTGGDVVPDYGGAEDIHAPFDPTDTSWPGAAVGDTIRVVNLGAPRDYTGPGPFGDGTFSTDEKGLLTETFAGAATVIAVDGATVTLDTPLPEGDIAYRAAGQAYAGVPGFAFARVMVGPDGARMVPHFLAVDVASDNRLPPTAGYTTTHTFAAACDSPVVHATLLHRNYPLALATERGWAVTDQVMTEVWR